MVEAAVGEAFEASLGLGHEKGRCDDGGGPVSSSSPGPQRFAGGHRSVIHVISRGETTAQRSSKHTDDCTTFKRLFSLYPTQGIQEVDTLFDGHLYVEPTHLPANLRLRTLLFPHIYLCLLFVSTRRVLGYEVPCRFPPPQRPSFFFFITPSSSRPFGRSVVPFPRERWRRFFFCHPDLTRQLSAHQGSVRRPPLWLGRETTT